MQRMCYNEVKVHVPAPAGTRMYGEMGQMGAGKWMWEKELHCKWRIKSLTI